MFMILTHFSFKNEGESTYYVVHNGVQCCFNRHDSLLSQARPENLVAASVVNNNPSQRHSLQMDWIKEQGRGGFFELIICLLKCQVITYSYCLLPHQGSLLHPPPPSSTPPPPSNMSTWWPGTSTNKLWAQRIHSSMSIYSKGQPARWHSWPNIYHSRD